jgi:regulator of ribonuclease activity A
MKLSTSKLCDLYMDTVDVMDPLFNSYGGRSAFYGQVVTIKCFEHRGIIIDALRSNGLGKVLVVDGGRSLRRAIIDEEIVAMATQNGWEGILCYGAVRDVNELKNFDIGVMAVGSIPVLSDDSEVGENDAPVNFAGVTIFSEDYIYADETGVILSQDPLDIA